MHAVVDTYSRNAFGFLHTSKQPEAAAAVLHNEVLPFYREKGMPIKAVLTDNGREFCGKDTHPGEIYLDFNEIEHRTTKVRKPQTNGFVERFNRTVLSGPNCMKLLKRYKLIWINGLAHYNTERPHLGYRNMGRRPIDKVNLFLSKNVRKEA